MSPDDRSAASETSRRPTRRRAIGLLAAAAGFPLLARDDPAAGEASRARYEWQGTALGARARLLLAHPSPEVARRAVALCLAEIARLERAFSLFLPDSELSCLNRDGRLQAPSQDLRVLLNEAIRFAEISGGAFDVSVQPLWRLYARHFELSGHDPRGPSDGEIAAARSLVGYRGIDLDDSRVRLVRPGMALTLNGIAQGYITDRVADLLRDLGFGRVLVQLGETRALEPPAGRDAWRIGIADPEDPSRIAARVALRDQAVATSSGLAARFDPDARHTHIFDPATGRSRLGPRRVTVVARRAVVADALSTALAVAPEPSGAAILRAGGADWAAVEWPDRSRCFLSGRVRGNPCTV
jgi:thiamine biosynthesis lipoprotein